MLPKDKYLNAVGFQIYKKEVKKWGEYIHVIETKMKLIYYKISISPHLWHIEYENVNWEMQPQAQK